MGTPLFNSYYLPLQDEERGDGDSSFYFVLFAPSRRRKRGWGLLFLLRIICPFKTKEEGMGTLLF
jgi:hypothetical protein